jgi:hypothetical protein
MPTFKELSDKERIQSIKDSLVLLLESILIVPRNADKTEVKDPAIIDEARQSKLAQYIKVEKPVIAEDAPAAEREKLEAEYQKQQATFNKVLDYIRSVKKTPNCCCNQGCFEITITNSILPPEFEPLLAAARKTAEERTY